MLVIIDIKKKLQRLTTMGQNRLRAMSAAKELHKQNIQRNIEHRLEVAKAHGDQRLIRQLEAELKYFS